MHIDTTGFHLSTPAPAAAPPAKRFLLEGSTDVFSAMPSSQRFSEDQGPVYPSLGRVIFRGLEALDTTVRQLGKHPSPEEVDRSNLRRLVRAMAPVAEAHRACYPGRAYGKAMGELSDLVKAVGRYKDVGVVETQVAGLCPGGRVPRRIAQRLEKTREKEAERFREAYKHFRKEGLERCLDVLGDPHRLAEGSPERIQVEDRRALGGRVLDLLDGVEGTGLVHRDPLEFHEGRKALRSALNTLGACEDQFAFAKEDLDAVKRLVDAMGVAQDCYIASAWLDKEGFREEARAARAQYDALQAAGLQEARRFEESGTLERLRGAVRSGI